MNINILGSSSKGNCYVVGDENNNIMLDAGLSLKKIKEKYGHELSKLSGCLITHKHKDHCYALKQLLKTTTPIYMSEGTKTDIGPMEFDYKIHLCEANNVFTTLDYKFSVYPFEIQHDTNEPLGFAIKQLDTNETLLYITDTQRMTTIFNQMDYIMVECNYDKNILNDNVMNHGYNPQLANRVLANHFEIDSVIEYLLSCDLSNTKEIHLLHLSDQNSNEADFKKRVQQATGIPVYVAAE